MSNTNSNKTSGTLFLIAGVIFLISAGLYIYCEFDPVYAACLGVAGLCLLFSGYTNLKYKNKE